MSPLSDSSRSSTTLTRREAIKRAALLLGVALSPSIIRGALADGTGPVPTVTGQPLSDGHRAILAAAVERMLPRTDTPGAIDVGVPAFIELLHASYLTSEERTVLESGLRRIEGLSQTAHRRAFTELTADQQDAVLRNLATSSDAADGVSFQQLRQLALVGFFTSKTVGTTLLQYDPVPGRYEADIPLSEVGKSAWYMS